MGNFVSITAAVQRLESRTNGMSTIDAKLDLGGGISVTGGHKMVHEVKAAIQRARDAESELGAAKLALRGLLPNVRDISDRMLAGVSARYGKNSEQYKRMGGKPKSERKRSPRGKAKAKGQAAPNRDAKEASPQPAPGFDSLGANGAKWTNGTSNGTSHP